MNKDKSSWVCVTERLPEQEGFYEVKTWIPRFCSFSSSTRVRFKKGKIPVWIKKYKTGTSQVKCLISSPRYTHWHEESFEPFPKKKKKTDKKHWININEQNPPDGWMLITYRCYADPKILRSDFGLHEDGIFTSSGLIRDVTHWMPVPDPAEENE